MGEIRVQVRDEGELRIQGRDEGEMREYVINVRTVAVGKRE